ncbi:MAG: aryl-alcohol dehydrogenase-like predicted oxidoreductase [Bradymonadia bacterium]|jgi:aryl-alcohol dehydrogenase-like predicted oxidoreductase
MDYRGLGRTGTQVSSLCLGAMTFGEPDEKSFMHGVAATEAASFEMLDRALDAGINFVDTADVYGNDGLSERVIGKWFARTGRRREVVLATKCRFRMFAGQNGTGASRRRIMEAVDASLSRLGVDCIDLYQIHMQDARTPEAEVLGALEDLVRQGKILYYGCSNYAAYRLVQSDWIADRRNLSGFATLQAQYSLAERSLEREHVPYMKQSGIGLLPWSPLAGGLLSGKYRKGEAAPPGSRMEKWTSRLERWDTPRNWRIVDALREVAAEVEASPAVVALAWLLKQPTVTSVIIGVRTLAQLEDNLKAAELELSDEALQTLTDASAFEVGYPYDFMHGVDGRW